MTDTLKKTALALLVSILIFPIGFGSVSAHGIVGGRLDLPVPLWLYLYGAAIVVALSFVFLGIFSNSTSPRTMYPIHNLYSHKWIWILFNSKCLLLITKIGSVGYFGLIVCAGILGDPVPLNNIAPVAVWVIWWIGMGIVVALLGNIWVLVNPWKAIFHVLDRISSKFIGVDTIAMNRRYPTRWGVWPAFAQFVLFIWIELSLESSQEPYTIAILALLYSMMTLTGMFIFGKHVWLRNGEMFSVYFGVLARFAPTELRVSDNTCKRCSAECGGSDNGCVNCYQCAEIAGPREVQLNLRPWAIGLTRNGNVDASMLLFVILMLSSVTFDGFKVTPEWWDILSTMFPVVDSYAVTVASTLGIMISLGSFLSLYLGSIFIAKILVGTGANYKGMVFGLMYSLVPIALVYNLAHYWTFLATTGQLIISLISDPFGWGWDLIGTAGYKIESSFVTATLVWYSQVVLVVIGHVLAVFLAHLEGRRLVRDPKLMLRSQIPLLGLMVVYTVSSLWILSRPIIERL